MITLLGNIITLIMYFLTILVKYLAITATHLYPEADSPMVMTNRHNPHPLCPHPWL